MSPLTEFCLPNGKRLDVAALGSDGTFVGVEIKVSPADFVADAKWPDYLPYCDLFYFAVPPDFAQEKLPTQIGLMVADRFGGAIVRASQPGAALSGFNKAVCQIAMLSKCERFGLG